MSDNSIVFEALSGQGFVVVPPSREIVMQDDRLPAGVCAWLKEHAEP